MPDSSYHHGDLRNVLLKSAWQLVSEKGVEAVSLRGVARAAGVSHTAPYHHFKDREDLMAGVAAAGFDRMAAIMRQKIETTGDAPLDALQGVGLGYVQFAVEHPAIFRLMFSGLLADRSQSDELHKASTTTWELLESMLGGDNARTGANQAPVHVPLTAWATVHGLAFLLIDGMLEEELASVGMDEITRRVTTVLGRGLKDCARPD